MRPTSSIFPSVLLPALAFVALTLPACVDPGAAGPVLAQQREVIGRLERASAEDLAALRSLADAVLAARRERLFASIEQRLVAGALDAHGRALDGSPRWLVEYAALLHDNAGADARRAPLLSLPEVREFDDAADALRASLDARAIATATLFRSLLADSDALLDASGGSVDLAAASREAALSVWRDAIAHRVDDPRHRAAVERLLSDLLAPSR